MKRKKSFGTAFSFLISLAAGTVFILLFSLAAAAVLSKLDVPEDFILTVSIAVPAISSALAGALCALLCKKNGLILGAAIGALLALTLLTVGMFIRTAEAIPVYFSVIRCAAAITAGALGGFFCIYTQSGKKRKRPL